MFRHRVAILRQLQVQISVTNNTLILVAQCMQCTISNSRMLNKQK